LGLPIFEWKFKKKMRGGVEENFKMKFIIIMKQIKPTSEHLIKFPIDIEN
jgi:hypothetical protein